MDPADSEARPTDESTQPQAPDASGAANMLAAFQRLAIRLLTQRYRPFADDESQAQLLPGQLAPQLPADFPLPPGADVIGAYSYSKDKSTTEIDVPLAPEQIQDFFREHLLAIGWQTQEPFPDTQRGGFANSPRQDISAATFFLSPHGPSLSILAMASPGKPSDLHISYDATIPDNARGPHRRRWRDMDEMIPALTAPPGGQQRPEGGGGGGGSWRASARLELDHDLDIGAIAAHYATQLTEAGWTLHSEDAQPPTAWSTWALTDKEGEPWDALFFLFQRPNHPHEYLLELRLSWVSPGRMRPTPGGFSYAPL